MVSTFVLFTYFLIAAVYSQDMYYPDNNMIIGNLRRREVIPLNPYYSHYNRRRYGADAQTNLNYRRTKDIREDFVDRRFELSEAQLREAKLNENNNKDSNLDKLHNELRWLTIDTDEGIDQQPNVVFIGQ